MVTARASRGSRSQLRRRQKRRQATVPVWLRRLHVVRAELRGSRYPRTADEGLRQMLRMSALALRWLDESGPSLRRRRPGATGKSWTEHLVRWMAQRDLERRRDWKRELDRCFR